MQESQCPQMAKNHTLNFDYVHYNFVFDLMVLTLALKTFEIISQKKGFYR